MRYLPTIQLWASGIQDAILNGQLKLQCGQWVKCGEGRLSRYVGHTKHSINVVHWQGSSKATNDLFLRRVNVPKINRAKMLERRAKRMEVA